MNGEQNLSLPKDIAWRRLAFSPDMFDTNFKDPSLPPKWRNSLAAFYYVVPEEETKDIYPGRRIMYLKTIASITGCNFTSEGLLANDFVGNIIDKLKPHLGAFPTSTLEILTGKLSAYYPCKGAILQVAVFPHSSEADIGLWDYPYIQDFEPKKRELYETVSKSGEMLAGSKSALNLKKGMTTTESVEESDILTGVKVKVGGWGVSAETDVSGKWGTEKKSEKEQSEVKTTDSSIEKRETQSYTASINQMYQPLLSYHLGTNRALWAISPRPHTVDSEFNLIDVYPKEVTEEGTIIGRKLEGIQDIFLVVNLPKNSKGLCFQTSLDAGYDVWDAKIDSNYFLVVMRRVIQSCGKFDTEGNFKVDYYPYPPFDYVVHPYVVNEIKNIPFEVLMQVKDLNNIEKKTELVFKANERYKYIMQRMLDAYSSRVYKPKLFAETDAFNVVLRESLKESTYKVSELEFMVDEKGLLERLKERRIQTVGDLMSAKHEGDPVVQPVRERILKLTAEIGKKIVNYQKEQYEKLQRKMK